MPASDRLDTDRIRTDNPLSETCERFGVHLRRDGHEWRGLCPFHSEDTASFTVFHARHGADRAHCFGCGFHGDVIDFVCEIEGVNFREACDILGGWKEPAGTGPRRPPRPAANGHDPYAGLTFIPPPDTAPVLSPGVRTPAILNPKRAVDGKPKHVHYTPTLVHRYPGHGYVLRVDIGSAKITPVILWAIGPATGSESGRWCHGSMPEPRPIYRLQALLDNPDHQVLIVEGEKCADAAAPILDRLVVVSWCGGGKAWQKTDWSPVAGRRVVLWPDHDPQGVATMDALAGHLEGLGCHVKVMDLTGLDAPDGWDVADGIESGWGEREIVGFARERARARVPVPGLKLREEVMPDDYGPLSDGVPRRTVETSPQPSPLSVAGANIPVLAAALTRLTNRLDNPIPPPKRPRAVRGNVIALHAGTDIPTDTPLGDPSDYRARMLFDDEGKLKPRMMTNFKWMLHGHEATRGMLSWNEFSQMPFLRRRPPWVEAGGGDGPAAPPTGGWHPKRCEETDITETTVWLEKRGLTPKRNDTTEAIRLVASYSSFNPVRDYLDNLVWDGCPRLTGGMWEGSLQEPACVEYLGSPATGSAHDPADNIFAVMVWKWFVAAIARVMRPGCQADTMLILESPQGYKKSSFFRAIATIGDTAYFYDDPGNIADKDSIIKLHGKWIIEIAELASLRRHDIYGTNAWITRRVDTYRPLFERTARDVPRQFILGASVNPSGYGFLRDPTGARRFWPVPVQRIDVPAVERDRDQLWAEAVALYSAGRQWWLTDEEQVRADVLTNERRAEDPWSYQIDETIAAVNSITVATLMQALDIPKYQRNEVTVKRITEHLQAAKFRRSKTKGEWVREGFQNDLLDDAPM